MSGCYRNNGGNCIAKIGEVCCTRAPGRITAACGFHPIPRPTLKLLVGSRQVAESVRVELPNGGYRDTLHLAIEDAGARSW